MTRCAASCGVDAGADPGGAQVAGPEQSELAERWVAEVDIFAVGDGRPDSVAGGWTTYCGFTSLPRRGALTGQDQNPLLG